MPSDIHSKLRQLIGKTCQHGGRSWLIADVLADEDMLVLQATDNQDAPVQRGLYGHPNRRLPEQLSLPLSDSDGGYSEDVLTLLDNLI